MSRTFAIVCVLLAACGSKEAGPPSSEKTGKEAATPVQPAETPAPAPITNQEVDTFGAAMAQALAGCDPSAVDRLIDTERFRERTLAAAGPDAPPALRRAISPLGQSICAGLGTEFSVRYVGAVEVGGSVRPRIRTIVSTGVNFLEPVLERRADGSVIAVDLFSFRNGEMMSELLTMTAKFMRHPQGEAAGRAFVTATQRNSAGDHAGARASFQSIPAELRTKIKAIALQGLTIDKNLDAKIYLASIAEFRKNFPDDPVVTMIEIDAHALRRDHEALVASLDALAARTGDDAYVRVLRAEAYRDGGDLGAAKRDAEAALAAEPALVPALEIRLEIAMDEKKWDDAVQSLRGMVAAGIPKAGLQEAAASEARYRALVQSAAYKAWAAEPS